ncbi:hypothetical protein FDP41_005828 [Naegleria fowleri]|uniref:Glycosyl hydrolases family 39 N-terminal catalytic domain-containing protein n=1 Tax=Naegleria fowleri TaxID=5763 RepID=A0A6A5BNB9_NAEFO|nr:uncharacterized protein FDP41_005828 [Naegleria fowleri]KAF0975075.1 hypothetical protein FDP41_005828 [Naegleria fowleri]
MSISIIILLLLLLSCTADVQCQLSLIKNQHHSIGTVNVQVNILTNPMSFKHYWKRSVGSCHATFCLRADWREQLKIAQKELGFYGIRFHGIFDDDMSVVLPKRHDPNTLIYSFYNVDNCYDFLVKEMKMKPIVELSFMPQLLASDPSKTIFHYNGGISPPKSMKQWNDLIYNFVSHLVLRYGIDEVSTWHFEVWNEPNLRNTFWTGTQQDYFNLYNNTAHVIKSISPRLKVGGPATAGSGWIQDFVNYVRSNNVPNDFVSTHEYPTDIEPLATDTLIKVAKQSRSIVGSNTPLFYTEWNAGLGDLGSGTYFYQDSSYPAALITRTLFSLNNVVDVYSYWTFSDLFEEHGQYSEVFQEGFGMMTIYSIRKPVWRAFQLMAKSGDELYNATSDTTSTVDVYTTLNRDTREVMIFASNYQVPSLPGSSYVVSIKVNTNLNFKNCVESVIDETHSNAFTRWHQIGSPTYPTEAQIKDLNDASLLFTQPITPKDGNVFVIQMENPSLHVITCNV